MEGLGVTAVRVCELMLLTLENEKQTWPERIEGCMGGRRGKAKKKEKEVVRTGMETAVL